MTRPSLLGTLEQHVLLAVIHCGADAYGMTIRRVLEDRTRRSVSLGAVYTTLERLEAKEYISSQERDPAESRRGRARRYFRLLPAGAEALNRSRVASERMWEGLPSTLRAVEE